MLDVSGTLHVFLFNDVAFASSHFFFCCHIELLALLLPLNVFCVLCTLLGYMEDVGGLPLAQKGKRPRNQKEGPRKAGWERSRSLHTETKMEVDLKMSLVSERVFLPPCFLEEEQTCDTSKIRYRVACPGWHPQIRARLRRCWSFCLIVMMGDDIW